MLQEWPTQNNQETAGKKPAIVRYAETRNGSLEIDQDLTIGDGLNNALKEEISHLLSQGNFSELHKYIEESEAGIANLPEEYKMEAVKSLHVLLQIGLRRFLEDVPSMKSTENSSVGQIVENKIAGLNFLIDLIEKYAVNKKNGNLVFDPKKIKSPDYNPYSTFLELGSKTAILYLTAFPERSRSEAKINTLIETYLDIIEEEDDDSKFLDSGSLLHYADTDVRFLNKIGSLSELFRERKEYVAERILFNLSRTRHSEKHKQFLVILLSDTIGAEETRIKLSELIYEEREKGERKDQNKINSLEYARALITPNHEKISTERMNELYGDKQKFEDYGLNKKMQPVDAALLKDLISKDQKVLDIGCGPGRLLLALEKDGYDVTGYDFTDRHVKLIKKQSPKAKVFKGDWKISALKDGSFGAAYSLGRNILHDYSLPDQVQTFREAQRILGPQGQFIFDIPDLNEGEYKQRVRDYADAMYELGIRNYRYGAIYDSPDGKHFSTRYAYSDEDIRNLAQISGFRIIKVRREELPTGKDDENIYYVLKKKTKVKDLQESWYTLLEYEEKALEIAQEIASKGGTFEEFSVNIPENISLSGGGQAQEIWQAAKDSSRIG